MTSLQKIELYPIYYKEPGVVGSVSQLVCYVHIADLLKKVDENLNYFFDAPITVYWDSENNRYYTLFEGTIE